VNAEQERNDKPLRNAFNGARKPSFRLLRHPSAGIWNTVLYTRCTLHCSKESLTIWKLPARLVHRLHKRLLTLP